MIVSFGEVLWDVYPDQKKLGGAPFNVAAHLKQLGSDSRMISRVGEDELGSEIFRAIRLQGIPVEDTQVDDMFTTGVVNVELDEMGKPSYEIAKPAAWDFIEATDTNRKLVDRSKAFVYGSLSSRSMSSRRTLLDLVKKSSINICDLNIRQGFYDQEIIESLLTSADILKINDEEAALLRETFGWSEEELYPKLTSQFRIKLIIQTLGAKGAQAYQKGKLFEAPAEAIEVVDTVGSGDAFLAAFIHNFLNEKPIDQCLKAACKLGGYVATQSGAIPQIPKGFM